MGRSAPAWNMSKEVIKLSRPQARHKYESFILQSYLFLHLCNVLTSKWHCEAFETSEPGKLIQRVLLFWVQCLPLQNLNFEVHQRTSTWGDFTSYFSSSHQWALEVIDSSTMLTKCCLHTTMNRRSSSIGYTDIFDSISNWDIWNSMTWHLCRSIKSFSIVSAWLYIPPF